MFGQALEGGAPASAADESSVSVGWDLGVRASSIAASQSCKVGADASLRKRIARAALRSTSSLPATEAAQPSSSVISPGAAPPSHRSRDGPSAGDSSRRTFRTRQMRSQSLRFCSRPSMTMQTEIPVYSLSLVLKHGFLECFGTNSKAAPDCVSQKSVSPESASKTPIRRPAIFSVGVGYALSRLLLRSQKKIK